MNVKSNPGSLKIIDPPYKSRLTDLVIELDYLRKKPLGGTTYPSTFFQLKQIFHTLESIGSARIEGNRTTIADFIETKISNSKSNDEKIVEINNGENALTFIDEYIEKNKGELNKIFLSDLHKKVVEKLTPPPAGEGSVHPGEYRKENVHIIGSKLTPPDYTQVPNQMEELLNFINTEDAPKYDLLKTALAHHRFALIHPFDNGNGRTVRLFTYAMLVRQGFNIHIGRIINPTAVFCNNRNEYYERLSKADTGTDEGILEWCEYVLSGLKTEIEKIDKLLDYGYLSNNILLPSIYFALERKLVTDDEAKILKVAVKKQVFQASDIKAEFPGKIPAEISRMIRKLKDRKMISPERKQERKYVLCFANNYLLRGIIEMLDKNGFLPLPLHK
jgi:Fic family protein